MEAQKTSSSRSAYLFVTINLVLLVAFLIGGSANYTTVGSTAADYDHLVHEWFYLRLALTDPRISVHRAVRELPEYQRFRALIEETGSSAPIRAAGQLSSELGNSVTRTMASWRALDSTWAGTVDEPIGLPDASRSPLMLAQTDSFQTALLDSQVVLDSFVNTQERASAVLLYCLAATIVLVIVVFVIVEAESERARRNAFRTQLLAQSTIEIQEQERARIARGLHDSLAQELSLATMETEFIRASIGESRGEAVHTSTNLKARLVRSVDWVRNLAYELRPAEIDDIGLAAAITTFCEERAPGNHVSFNWHVNGEIKNLPSDKAINIYRIVQESVTNALRHSRADRLTLELQASEEQIELTVADNGIGMGRSSGEISSTHSGLGVAGMKERARMLDGALSIHSQRRRGTVVQLTVPLDKPENGRKS
ncbi:MAG: sensor histidine kinase [Spirochaetales bacterium]|nr:sensor histidine kinase [Spirochaetales bacterium]